VRDPVCGMTVDRTKALTLETKGTTHYFCSESCRSKFQHDEVVRVQTG
jgi:YHS domain-containing protein